MPKLHADLFFKFYLEHLRIFKSKSEETREWMVWLQENAKGSYQTEADALEARNFLALCSIQFTRERLQNELTRLEYFCKLWGLSTSNSYQSLLLKSIFGKKLIKQNDEVSFECFLFGIYRSIWQGLEAEQYEKNFISLYQLINSLVEQIPVLYPRTIRNIEI